MMKTRASALVFFSLFTLSLGAACATKAPAPLSRSTAEWVALGETRLQARQYREAAAAFEAALIREPASIPALAGAADARLGMGDDPGALRALEALIAADPSRTDARARLEAVRLRVVQVELAEAERARAAGKLDEAQVRLQRALDATPENGAVLRAFAALELERSAFENAETHARKAIALDAQDASAHALLGSVLEAQGRVREAIEAYNRALALDARPAWKEKRDALSAGVSLSALPEEYRAIPSAATVTRAQVAALLGVRLEHLLTRAPRRAGVVVTDVRGHWAAPWIHSVLQAGWMDALPNHTFQASAPVMRSDLAKVAAGVLGSLTQLAPDVSRWRALRPTFSDLPRDHSAYAAAALAVSAGVLKAPGGRFAPAGLATGAELMAAVARLEQLAR